MKSVVYTEIGSPEVLKLMESPKPIVNNNQVLIRVNASAINNMDYMMFDGLAIGNELSFMGKRQAKKGIGKHLGAEVSGIVEEVGKSINTIKKGDEVYAITTGLQGGWSEYALADSDSVYLKPTNLTFEQAAAIPLAGSIALAAVKAARVKSGVHVMVYGASGGIGQYAVQIAKAFGAVVTGVCSTRNIETVRRMGADCVIDYSKEDFTQIDTKYDAILAVNGYNSIGKYKKLLAPAGVYIAIGGAKQGMQALLGPLLSIGTKKKLGFIIFAQIEKDLKQLSELAEMGEITPVIDNVFSFEDAPDAMWSVLKNHPQGKTVISVA